MTRVRRPNLLHRAAAATVRSLSSQARAYLLLLIVLAWIPLSAAQAETPPPGTPAALRVITGYSSPFVQLPGTPVSGYSIEVWHEVARRLGVETVWTVLPDLSDEAQLAAVLEGRADAAISALTITAEREARVDFSVPYFDSGLRIMVGTQAGGVLRNTLSSLASPAVLGLLAIGAGLLVALAHLLWLVERGHNPAFQQGYLRSISEGLWGTWLIFSTGEHGDRDTPRVVKRLAVGTMWLFGVLFIAQLTAIVTSGLTVQQLRSSIEGPDDLPGKTIATAPGSIAAAWLTRRGLPFVPVSDSEAAYAMLIRGDIQAIVYDAPQLEHWLATRGPSQASLVGPVFRPQRYGVAVPLGSPLRKRINAALLAMQEDGTAEAIAGRWFGTRR